VNSGRAYAAMRARYPTWEALASARTADLVRVIRPGGLANTKAPRILAVLREIREREGRFDLSWMADASDREISEYLTSLPGVGPKTVAVVLAFALGRPALPVDTHVHRVAGRLELVPPRSTAVQAQIALERLVPPRLRVPMHVGLIRHGRQICRAGRPRCEDCVLQDICPSAELFLAASASGARGAKNPKRA
jgi:endonuclease III